MARQDDESGGFEAVVLSILFMFLVLLALYLLDMMGAIDLADLEL